MNHNLECSRVLQRRGTMQEDGSRLHDDELCPNTASTDVIVTFNGNAYVVPLCAEHKRHHDQAAADRRAKRSVAARRDRDDATSARRIAHVTRSYGGSQ